MLKFVGYNKINTRKIVAWTFNHGLKQKHDELTRKWKNAILEIK